MKSINTAALALVATAAMPAFADVDFYAKGNVTLEYVSEGEADYNRLQSNASRIGVRGSEQLSEQLEAIYQVEVQVDMDDFDEVGERNIYLGVKGDFGTVIGGHFDSAFKRTQNKVDLFNDLPGDIKNIITVNDNRPGNSVMYISPNVSGFVFTGHFINSEDEAEDNGLSLAAQYTWEDLYLALGVDDNVEEEGSQAVRFVAQYQLGTYQLGGLVEQYEAADSEDSETGAFVSLSKTMGKHWVFKIQGGTSDIVYEGGTTASVGADYKLTKNAKVFAFYTTESDDDGANDEADGVGDYLGLGFELKI